MKPIAWGLALVCSVGISAEVRADECLPTAFRTFGGVNTQDGRLFRDAVPSTCGAAKAYPGTFATGNTMNFETDSFANPTDASVCVTISFDPDTDNAETADPSCGTNAHASAYLGSYNPADQPTNFVGDVGSSQAQPFAVDVPAGATLVVVVTNTTAAAVCDYQYSVDLCSVCGDGMVTLDEDCDVTEETADCNANCKATVCGDGTLNEAAGESCDDAGESLDCDVDCTPSSCGDGVTNAAAGETCDDGNATDGDGCSAACIAGVASDVADKKGGCQTTGSASGLWLLLALAAFASRRARRV